MTMTSPTGGGTEASSFKLPSFWKRREGKFGGRIMLLAAAALGVIFHQAIFGFLISLFANMLMTVGLAAAVFVVGYLFINDRSRAAMMGIVQMLPNLITSLFYMIGAEGYLLDFLEDRRNKIRDAESRRDRFSGILNRFQQMNARKSAEADKEMKVVGYAHRKQAEESVSDEDRVKLKFQQKLSAYKAGMARDTALTYRQLYERLKKYYDQVVVAIEASKFILAIKETEYQQLIEQRHAVQEAKGAVDLIKPLFRGDSRSQLADEFAMRMLAEMDQDLGEIDGFFNSLDSFLGKLDIEQGIYEEDALAQIESMGPRIDAIVEKVERKKRGLPEPAAASVLPDAMPQTLTQGSADGGIRSIADLIGGSDKTQK